MEPKKNSTIIKQKLAQPRAEQSKYYIDNEKLCGEVEKYVTAAKKAEKQEKPRPKIPDSIGRAIILIAERLASMNQFINYTYKDEMIADAVHTCVKYITNFDTKKTRNPFAYFTQVVYYSFIKRIEDEKRHAYVKYKTIFNAMTDPSQVANDNLNDPDLPPNILDDLEINLSYLGEYCETYENKNNLKGKRKKKTQHVKFKPAKLNLEKFIDEEK